jgi:DNA transformation protein and related proteins
MVLSKAFRAFVEELLADFGPVRIKPMFGGAGISQDGVNFAFIVADTLYFKADDGNRAAFEAEGMTPFGYTAKGKPVVTSYWRVPERLLEDPEALQEWAREALAAAGRAKKR